MTTAGLNDQDPWPTTDAGSPTGATGPARPAAPTGADQAGTRSRRSIGAVGTAARLAIGLYLLGAVLAGEASTGFHAAAWLLALVGLPAGLLALQWLRARRFPARLRATGPAGHALNLTVLGAMYATPWYAPSARFTSDAALVFYGSSMLVAAVRGYAGCEVLAIPNWLLRRDDQVGCLVFSPIDALERRRSPR